MEKFLKPLIVLSLLVFIFTAYVVYQAAYQLSSRSAELTPQEAAAKAVSYINNLSGGQGASLLGVTEESGLYKIHISIGQDDYESFVTKDGKILFRPGSLYYMDKNDSSSDTVTPTPISIELPKSDRPDVKVFVMSYCPYGLQAEKMMLPVYDLLKNKIDIGIYFVDYAMHGKQELDENLLQYCLQNENQSQYFEYLDCFIQSGDSESCVSDVGIDTSGLTQCISSTDATYNITGQFNDQSTWLNGNYPIFNIQEDLNDMYGVSGSPTIIINGVKATVNPRSPENFKQVICSAFNTSPEECSQTLSNEAPSAGFQ